MEAKVLKDILYKVSIKALLGSTDISVTNLCIDSRKADREDLFIARKGVEIDSHQYIPSVIEKGVKAIICERLPMDPDPEVTYVCVDNSDIALGIIASNFYDNPSGSLILCGVTGTNGKTTIATLLYQLFMELGYATGLLSTIRIMVNDRKIDATHTTPDSIQLNRILHRQVVANVWSKREKVLMIRGHIY